MKRIVLLLIMCITALAGVQAQRALMIQRQGGIIDAVSTSQIDSLSFSPDGLLMNVATGGRVVTIPTADVVDMTYGDLPTSFLVNYVGSTVTIVNPYFTQGVSVSLSGANVVVNNENIDTEFTFTLSGSTSSGSLLYNGNYKATFVLNGVSITNPKGPAIDIECGKRIALELKKGMVNTLADGANGDWKAALYCKGHLEIDKAGTLNVTGNTKHAISAKEYLQLKKADGVINILGAKSDGIHCGQYFLANGYTVNIKNVLGDGIQAEARLEEDYAEDYPDGSLSIQGGAFTIAITSPDATALQSDNSVTVNAVKSEPIITITASGAGSKGIKSDVVTIEAGNLTITNSGVLLSTDGDTQTAKCISADTSVRLVGGIITLSTTGQGGKCIKSDGTYVMGDPATGMGPVLKASTTGAISGTVTGTATNPSTGGGTGAAFVPGTYRIACSANTTYGLDITGASTANNANVEIWAWDNANHQKFEIAQADASYFYIKAVHSGKYIDLYAGGNTEGTNAMTWQYDGTATQKWTISDAGDGAYYIVNSNGLYLDVSGGTVANGTNVQGWTGNQTAAQKWVFIPVEVTSVPSGGGFPGGGGPGGGNPPGGGSASGSSAKAIKAIGAVTLYGGESTITTLTDGAEGLESKTSVTVSGGKHYFKCYDDCINSAGPIKFLGGVTVCYATGNDAVDSNYGRTGAITIGDGTVFAYTTRGAPEEGFDCDNNSYIQITGSGIAISAGGAQGGGGGSSTISGASQGYNFVTNTLSYTTGRYYTLADSSGKNLVTYSFEGNVSSSLALFTAKGMTRGSTYTVKYSTSAPTNATTAFHGLYLGSTAQGTTSVTSFSAK